MLLNLILRKRFIFMPIWQILRSRERDGLRGERCNRCLPPRAHGATSNQHARL